MKTTTILYALCLVLISIFLLSVTWEFGLEDRILPLVTDEFEPESSSERWEYIISATLFAGLVMVFPALLLLRSAARLRRLHAELEARVEQRTRELRHQLDERRLAESLSARMGRIIENALDEVYVLDAENLGFLQVNRRGRENLSFAMDQLQTRSCVDLVPGWTRESFEEMLRPLCEGTRNELVFETRHQRKDGSQCDLECRIQYLPEEQPPVFVVMLQDITARKQMEAQIVEARDKAQVIETLRAGASGYIIKGSTPKRLLDAIHTVAGGGSYLDPAIASQVMGRVGRAQERRSPHSHELTDREPPC